MPSRVDMRRQKLEDISFGARALNAALKKQSLLIRTRETNSALSRRGHFGYDGIHWSGFINSTWDSLAR